MLDEHLDYVSDPVRLGAFRAAIAEVVRPGDRVADIGCGSGILGLLCLQAGAGSVVAIDSTAMIEVARQTLTRAGFADRTTFFAGHSGRAEIDGRVDVAICDHVGYFGFDYDILQTMLDVRRRFLKPGGRLIPQRIGLRLAAVETEAGWAKAHGWRGPDVPPEFHWVDEYGINAKHAVELKPDAVLADPAVLGDLDLGAETPQFLSWRADFEVRRDGTLHGLTGWFDCALSDTVSMTNSPLAEHPINRPQAFLPIAEALPVKAGDRIAATVMVRPDDHLIAWTVEHPPSGRRFAHSTWQGLVLAPEDLSRLRPDRRPVLSRDGRARQIVLGYCDGERTAREVEQAVLRDHPALLPSPDAIARLVAQALARDTEA